MIGLETLAYALGVTVALMATIFVLSRILLRFGLFPLAGIFSISGYNYFLLYLLVFPGTVVHEMSHYLACIVTGVHVREVRLFSPQKSGALGWVLSDPADPFRRTLIALAPFLGGSLAIYALMRFGLPSSQIDSLTIAPSDLVEGFRVALSSVMTALRSVDMHRVATWLILYTLFSLGFAVAPSSEDIAPQTIFWLVLLGIVIAIRAADGRYGWALAQSSLLNSTATFFAGVLQKLNALLLFSCAVVALGTLLLVPFAMAGYWLRSGLKS